MKQLCTLVASLMLGALPLAGHAATPVEAPAAAPGKAPTEGCIDVSVGGYKAPDYGCLSKQMGNNPDGAKAEQKNQEAMQVPIHKRPPNQMGLSTPAATSTQMGNTFGTSVKPQRP
ncbi:hypothetical protein PCAU_2699 [Pseudomonas chlororaphis subsp. aurantiaca]|uniref:hypothetical protein n=1 Tax=Pseudomonas chlororaphis TaxID=587753 RepID=UPI00086528D2|nr:hypothetical protein [Pseudomonas chlororaphis]BAV74908.1 hypothetical protein PCAU_2699 [Pseudomonas chlororaphis subsp. aurantiaca]